MAGESDELCDVPIEIQVNMTPETTDDVVQLKCDHPSHRHVVACRIRINSSAGPKAPSPPAGADVTVVLTNPDGRLRFANLFGLPKTLVVSTQNAVETKKVVLPKNGGWATFYITGEERSLKIGDAVIEVHRDSAKGPVCAKKQVTVFWFGEAKVTVTAGAQYKFNDQGAFKASPPPSVRLSASARIMPKDLDHSAPQIDPLRIAIMQEMLTDYFESVTYADPPSPNWDPAVAVGESITVPLSFRVDVKLKSTVKAPLNDRRTPRQDKPKLKDPWPLYSNESFDNDEGEKRTAEKMNMKQVSIALPLGRQGGGPVLTWDSPDTEGTLGVPYFQARETPRQQRTLIEYRISEWAFRQRYRTFCVVWNKVTHQEPDWKDPKLPGSSVGAQVPGTGFPAHCGLRQVEWELKWDPKKFKDMAELNKHRPQVTVGREGDVTVDPSIDGWANDNASNEDKKRTAIGTDTKTFTRTK
jgi:hypothetical protein